MIELTAWITTWIAANGSTVGILFFVYLIFLALVGSMPRVSDTAPSFARWAYGFLHLFALNLQEASKFLPIKLPNFLKKKLPDKCDKL